TSESQPNVSYHFQAEPWQRPLAYASGLVRKCALETSSRLLKNESRSVSRSSLWFSVRSLCLCGECFCSHFHHRVTENHRDRTEKSLTQLEPMTFSAAC